MFAEQTFTRPSPQARLLYLWSEATAAWPGVLAACDAAALRAGAFPLDDVTVAAVAGWAGELAAHGLWVSFVTPAGRPCVWLPHFVEDQPHLAEAATGDVPRPPEGVVRRWNDTWRGRCGRWTTARAAAAARGAAATLARRQEAVRLCREWVAAGGEPKVALNDDKLTRLVEACLRDHPAEVMPRALEVYRRWLGAHRHDPARTQPTKDRVRHVLDRLAEGYSVEQLEAACHGILRSPYHCGQNETGTQYLDLVNVCRSGQHVERFLALTEGGKRLGVPAHDPDAAWEADVRAAQEDMLRRAVRDQDRTAYLASGRPAAGESAARFVTRPRRRT
jgi:hypothetical protein